MVYRPVRERHPEVLKALARKLVDNTGYNEISLVSLSTADYTCLAPMIHDMIAEFKDERVSVSLPSLRIDSFSVDLAKEVQAVRKSGLTFAPEAGSQRMRDVINKGVTEEDLMNAVSAAFKSGWSSVKLYFMIGLPGETDEDVLAIADLAKKVQYKYREITGKGGCKVTVSASSFVPKPYTPFQWSAQNSMDELRRKQYLLKDALKVKNITFQYHDPETSIMEAVFARGDRRLGKALYLAWQRGAKFDGWSEQFDYERWLQALQDCGLDKEFYIARERGENEVFPWEHIQPAVSRAFLRNEYKKAQRGELTHDCRRGSCTGCGVCQNLAYKLKWKVNKMKLRLKITKDKSIRFISHLEYVRTIERAIRRAKLPAAYSEGFNPHLKFSLASALGVGVVSYAEFCEIELAEPMTAEEAAEKMQKALPRGIRILAADVTATNAPALMAEAGGADYRVTLPYDKPVDEAVAVFNEAESIIYAKAAPKAKTKVKEIDVKFFIPHITAQNSGGELVLTFSCRITPNGSMKAVDLINTLNQQYNLNLPAEKADIERLDLYKYDAFGNKLPMLGKDMVVLGQA